jgi:hypothetical protein
VSESFDRYVFGDLGYALEVERLKTTAAGAHELTPTDAGSCSQPADRRAPRTRVEA